MKYQYKDVVIDYEIQGKGKPILFIHGYGVDRMCILNRIEPMKEQLEAFQRYYIDLPHMGESNWPDSVNSSDDFLEVIENFVKDLIPGLVGVVGYSFGGYLAIGLQQLKSELPAFLICPVTEPISNKRTLPEEKILYVDEYILNMNEDPYGFKGHPIQTKEIYERFLGDFVEAFEKGNSKKLGEIYHTSYKFSFDLDKPVSGKTVALFGRLDTVVGFKDFWKIDHIFENVDVTVLDHASHSLPIEHVDKFEQLFIEWVRKL